MQDQIQTKLKQLRSEFASGKKMLAELDNKREQFTGTLLRIEGAIQVLEEMLEQNAPQSKSISNGNGLSGPESPIYINSQNL